MSQMRQWVIQRGEKYFTNAFMWSKDMAKARVYSAKWEAEHVIQEHMTNKGDAKVVPHWVPGEAW